VKPPSRTPYRIVVMAMLALAPAGCIKGTARTNPFAPRGSRGSDGEIRVRVENLNFADATIHALRGGERIRLGQVTGKSEKNFTVRWNFSLPIEFQVDLVGGEACGIQPMTVDPGDRVWLRIPTQVGPSPCYAGKT
jgi:hypothetical protein